MWSRTKGIIKSHRCAIILACLAGILYVAPYLYFMYDLGANYKGVQMTQNDEKHYLATVREVKEGYLDHSSTYLYEYKDSESNLLKQYPINILGVILDFLPISLIQFYLTLKFLFGAIIFLSLYYLAYLFFKDKRIGVVFALFTTLGGNTMISSLLSVDQMISLFKMDLGTTVLLPLSRFVNPLITLPLFVGGILSSFLLFKSRDKKFIYLNSILLGLNFYNYFFFVVFLLTLNGIIFLYSLVKRKNALFKRISVSIGLALLFGSYYLISIISELLGAGGNGKLDPAAFLAQNNSFRIDIRLIVPFFIYLIYLYYKREYQNKKVEYQDIFIVFLFITAFIVNNQRVITGLSIEEHHFFYRTNPIPIFLSLSVIFFYLIDHFENYKFRKILFFAISLFILLFGIFQVFSGYNSSVSKFKYYQNYGPIFNWLSTNTKKDSVVLSNRTISELIPVYTHNNVYFAPHSVHYTSNPLNRRLHNASMYYFLNYRNRETSRLKSFKQRKFELGSLILRLTFYRYQCGSKSCYPNIYLRRLAEYYDKFKNNSFKENLKKYKIDYIVWDKNKSSSWDLNDFDFLRKVYENNNIVIFTVN